jgi:hypothetical protein
LPTVDWDVSFRDVLTQVLQHNSSKDLYRQATKGPMCLLREQAGHVEGCENVWLEDLQAITVDGLLQIIQSTAAALIKSPKVQRPSIIV